MRTTSQADAIDSESLGDDRRRRISELGELCGQFRWEGDLDDLRKRQEAEAR